MIRTASALLCVLLLTACGDEPPTTAAPPTPAPTPDQPPAAEAPPAGPATPATPATFRFGNHVPPSAIVAVEGVDTANARLVGRTTPEAARAYCADMLGPEASDSALARCVSADPAENEMTADCAARTVSDGSPARWVSDQPAEGGKVLPVWRDIASGQTRDYSGAGGGYVLTAAFRIMCPTASANVAPDPF